MITFMKWSWIYACISCVCIGIGFISLARFGLKLGIDFTGGTLYEVAAGHPISDEDVTVVRTGLEQLREQEKFAELHVGSVQKSGESQVLIRLSALGEGNRSAVRDVLRARLGEITDIRFESLGPSLGRELLLKALLSLCIVIGGILAYVAWTFKNIRYGIAAVLAMLHDSLMLIGSFSLLGAFRGVEIDSLFVAAFLTVLSFSVHDTIVVFDRIRETAKRSGADFSSIADHAVSDTLVRSLNNSLTILFMLLTLLLIGGDTIRYFVVALFIGTVSGTYSSPFVAVPLLVALQRVTFRR